MAASRKSKSAGAGKAKPKTQAVEAPAITGYKGANSNGNGAATREVIRLRAYEIFLERGGEAGDEVSDWLAAEREIMGKQPTHV